MNELVPIFKQFGVWLGVLIVVTYFLLRHWWPYWKIKDQEKEADRRAIMERMMTFQETSLNQMTDALRSNNRLSEKIAEHLEELTDEIRRK
jgi:hypothetical protein